MDSAIDKIGIYDFFACFLSGVIFEILCLLSGVSSKYFLLQGFNDTIEVISFLLMGCFYGLIIQGIGSLLDKQLSIPCFKHWTSCNFLNESESFFGILKVFKDDHEREEMRELVNRVCEEYFHVNFQENKNENERKSNCYNVYQHCVEYLQKYGNMEKIERIGSTYGMIRSLMVATFILLLIHLFYLKVQSCPLITILVFLTLFFAIRATAMAKYRTRVILRQYKLLTTTPEQTETDSNAD